MSSVLAALTGCIPGGIRHQPGTPASIPTAGRIQAVEQQRNAQTRALLAFAQFRLLGADGRWEEALSALQHAEQEDPGSIYLKLLLARVYLHLERPDPAIELLTRLVEDSPDLIEAHLLLGDISSMQQRRLESIDHFQRALELSPDNETLYLRLAMVYVQLDRIAEALMTLEELLQMRPDAHQAMVALARIYRDGQQINEAIRAYRRYLEIQPEHLQVVLEFGRLLEESDTDAALQLYQDRINQDPFSPAIRHQLAQLYLTMRQPEQALEQMLLVREQMPALQPANQIGLVYLHTKQWHQAQKEFEQLISAGQATDKDRYYLALALIGQAEYAAAMVYLEQISAAADIYQDAMLQLAYLQQQEGLISRGTALLESLLEQGFRDPEVYYYLVAFYQQQEDLQQALNLAILAVASYPEDTRLLYQLGILHDALEDHSSALNIMEDVLQVDGHHADALNFLAFSQAESGTDLDLALERALLAVQLKPAGYIEDTLGWVYFKLGRYTEGRVHLERANVLQPEDPVILEHLGDLYRAMGLYDKAKDRYLEVLELNPEAHKAARKLNKLRGGTN